MALVPFPKHCLYIALREGFPLLRAPAALLEACFLLLGAVCPVSPAGEPRDLRRGVLTQGTREAHPLRCTSRTMRSLSLLSLVLATVLGVRHLSAQTVAPSADQTMLSPGDSVRIVVWRKPEFSGDFVIAPDGSVSHPLFRD